MSDAYFVALAQAAVVHDSPSEWKYTFLVPNSSNPLLQTARITDIIGTTVTTNKAAAMSPSNYLKLFDQTSSTSDDPMVLAVFRDLIDQIRSYTILNTRASANARRLLAGTRFEKYFNAQRYRDLALKSLITGQAPRAQDFDAEPASEPVEPSSEPVEPLGSAIEPVVASTASEPVETSTEAHTVAKSIKFQPTQLVQTSGPTVGVSLLRKLTVRPLKRHESNITSIVANGPA